MRNRRSSDSHSAFTLIELMAGTAVLLVIVAMLLGATNHATGVLRRTTGKIEQFGEARRGFENVTRRLASATLNTYWDYSYTVVSGSKVPSAYVRQSELRFRSGSMEKLVSPNGVSRPGHGVFFQAPTGSVEDADRLDVLGHTLNTWGYFLEIADDREFIPSVLRDLQKPRRRSRLLELQQPTERLSIYRSGTSPANWWYADSINLAENRPVHVLAENIVSLVILPRLSRPDEIARGNKPALCPAYDYDSTRTSNHTPALNPPDAEINPKNQLPPVVQVVMVAIDEISAARLDAAHPNAKNFGVETGDLFKDSALLEDNANTPEGGDGDLHTIEQRLIEQKATYRIFSTSVAIRGAKWSKAETN
jgi:uncharacterized protein (TIGR02599 family)